MATSRSKLVNLQYNSPIKLYSAQNINDTLNKQTQLLANGAVGIDFHNLAKPGNLAHSQVLKMLEEEESRKQGKYSGPGLKKVTWPPPPEEGDFNGVPEQPEPTFNQNPVGVNPGSPGVRQLTSPLYQPNQPRPQFQQQPQSPQLFQPQQYQQQPQSPHPFQPQQYQQQPNTFRPVQSVKSPSPVRRHPGSPYKQVEPPKATVTLLPSAPVKQEPPQVYASQPAAATLMGGNRMRGDEKWPPENVKQQTEAENAARIALAKGPTCRPRKVKKDYSTFFAQHALNATYPSYKAPPGTQHYIEEGTSNL